MVFETHRGDVIKELEQMRLGVDYHLTVTVRGLNFVVRPLSIAETNEVAAEVAVALKSMPPEAQNRLMEHSLLAKKTLVMASTSDVGKRDPKITEYIFDRATPDELSYIYKQYVTAVDRVNPALEFMTQEQVEELVQALKKTPKEELGLALIELSFLDLASIVRSFLTKDD